MPAAKAEALKAIAATTRASVFIAATFAWIGYRRSGGQGPEPFRVLYARLSVADVDQPA
jgi:hypothetical protein